MDRDLNAAKKNVMSTITLELTYTQAVLILKFLDVALEGPGAKLLGVEADLNGAKIRIQDAINRA